MVDLMRAAQQMIATTFRPLEIFFTAGLLYLVMTAAFSCLFGSWEKRLASRGQERLRPAMCFRAWLADLASTRGMW